MIIRTMSIECLGTRCICIGVNCSGRLFPVFLLYNFPTNAEDESHVHSYTYEEIKYITIFAGMIL